MSAPLQVLVNSYAGLGLVAGERKLARTLADLGIPAVIETVEPRHMSGRVRALAGTPVLAVAGGDGTQRTAARELAGSGTTLVPLPTGTLNHFARRLGLDSIEGAAEALRSGRVRTVPIGMAGDHVFLNTAIAGAYPSFVKVRSRLRPFLTKWPAALVASWVIFARWPRIEVDVRAPDMATRSHTAMLWVGLGEGSFPAVHESPLPEPDDALEAVILTATGRRAGLKLAGAALRQRVGSGPPLNGSTELIRAPWIDLGAAHPIPMALDGEPVTIDPPVRIRFQPHALRVPDARQTEDREAAG